MMPSANLTRGKKLENELLKTIDLKNCTWRKMTGNTFKASSKHF